MMKSNFLNLPSSGSGDARRHVPFRSIINKHFSILFVLVFVFSIMFSYVHPVAALADPVFQPVYDTQFYQLPQFVDPLNSTQQDIFYFILGSQVVEYAGLSDYQIENPYSDPSSVGEWFKKIGIDLYNDVLESFAIAGAPVIAGAKWVKDLYANIAGAANFAGAFNNTSWSDWYNDVQTNGLSLELYPAMFGALNQFFAFNNYLYNWQFDSVPFDNLPFNTSSISESNMVIYDSYVSQLSQFPIAYNVYYDGTFRNLVSDNISEKCIFFNTITQKVYITDLAGNDLTGSQGNINIVYTRSGTPTQRTVTLRFYSQSFTSDSNTSFVDLVNQFMLRTGTQSLCALVFNTTAGATPLYNQFVKHVYVGSNWSNKTEVIASENLNFADNNNQDTLTPIIDTLLDIKGLINDLLEQNELKQPALDNLTDLNGDSLPASQLQPVSVAVELPDSGITINSGLFTPLTKNGGYINYLWYMTKPLVQYTSDLVQTLVFPDDTGEGFDATGPGVIVFGVISLGLIGGLVVKCLL